MLEVVLIFILVNIGFWLMARHEFKRLPPEAQDVVDEWTERWLKE